MRSSLLVYVDNGERKNPLCVHCEFLVPEVVDFYRIAGLVLTIATMLTTKKNIKIKLCHF